MARMSSENPPMNRMCRKSARYRGAAATTQTPVAIIQFAIQIDRASVVFAAGSFQSCSDRITTIDTTNARTYAMRDRSKPYSATREMRITSPAVKLSTTADTEDAEKMI